MRLYELISTADFASFQDLEASIAEQAERLNEIMSAAAEASWIA